MFHFLLSVAKGISSLNNHGKRTIRIEFLNLARQTKHTRMETESSTQFFPFLLGSWIRATPLDYKSPTPRLKSGTWRPFAPTCVRHENYVLKGWKYVPLPD